MKQIRWWLRDKREQLGDIWLKLRLVPWFFPRNLLDWYHEIWKQDPDERLCCSGYMCGCQGTCHYEYWKFILRRKD